MLLDFHILSWSAWSPAYQQAACWKDWQKATPAQSLDETAPALSHVPAIKRRRFSRLSKMMLQVAYDTAAPSNCRSVFASRHGELNRTIGLLEDVIQQNPLSPTAFSQSVHNTASGLYGIVSNNQRASTSIAAGQETLAQAMFEAFGLLAENNDPILLVYGDDPVPPIYDEFTEELEYPLAFAWLLASGTSTLHPSLLIDTQFNPSEPLCYGALLQALAKHQQAAGTVGRQYWQLTPGLVE